MNIVSIDDVSKNVKEEALFTNVRFGIDAGEHIGLVGPNGAGKSTFLRLLEGDILPDEGTISRAKDLTISMLEQRPFVANDDTLRSFLYRAKEPIFALANKYQQCATLIADGANANNATLQKEFSNLTHLMEEKNAFALEHSYESLLTELKVDTNGKGLDCSMQGMSGGMIKKVAIARLFTAKSSLLLLDEPTNHLDIETIEWLEKRLADFDGSFVLVTHDRYFLDKVCTSMLDIDRKKISKYEGNFSTYLRRKKERKEEETRHDEKREAILTVELAWLKRAPKARSLKDSHRKARIEALLNERKESSAEMENFSSASRRLGGKILNIKNLCKNWHTDNLQSAPCASTGQNLQNSAPVIKDFSYQFNKGERIGIIGPNGSGKSTFLNIIAGRTAPSAGTIDVGVNTVFGYFDQTAKFINKERTVLEFMREKQQHVHLKDGSTCSIEQFLEKFLFPRAMFNQKLSYLSGGELRRLQLIELLAKSPNFLLFDEPTNDFDIETISILEHFLQDFDGCLVVVSHDRAFLDAVTDFLFVFDGKGGVEYFPCSYADYRLFVSQDDEVATSKNVACKNAEPCTSVKNASAQTNISAQTPKKKLSFKEQKEFDTLLDDINELEEEKMALETFFASDDFAKATSDVMAQKQHHYQNLCALIEEKTLRWEELAERA